MARRSLETHDHSKTGSGGDDLNPKSIGKETPAESIATESVTISDALRARGLTQGTESDPIQYLSHGTGGDFTAQMTSGTTIAGDNTAVDILSLDPLTGDVMRSGELIVMGEDQDSTKGFTDRVLIASVTGIAVDSDPAERGDPGIRSYSESAGNIQLAVDDSDVTYDVAVTAAGGLN